jgi:hypothetical protein
MKEVRKDAANRLNEPDELNKLHKLNELYELAPVSTSLYRISMYL